MVKSVSPILLKAGVMWDRVIRNEERLRVRKQVLKGLQGQTGKCFWWFGEVGGSGGRAISEEVPASLQASATAVQ